MGLFSSVERRQWTPEPPILPNAAQGGPSIRSVSLNKAEAAMAKVAIYASVNLICSIGEQLPGYVYSGIGSDQRVRVTPSWLKDIGGQGFGTNDWIWQLLYCWALRGNAVGVLPTTGTQLTIDLQHPDDVTLRMDQTGSPEWTIRGSVVPAGRVWHTRVYPVPGRILGNSPIAQHAVTISQGLYAQNFGAQWFADGGHPSAILTNNRAQEIDQPTAQTVKERFLAAVRGTREPVVLGGGWSYKQIQIAPGESQFIETQNLTSAECARIYGPGMPELLGYETGGSMTYANISQRSVDLLKYTLNPWLVRVEKVISDLLPQPQTYKFDRDALLQTDALTRWQTHMLSLKSGSMTINEIRTGAEDMQPVEWGDSPYLPALGPAAAAAAVNTGDPVPDGTTPDSNTEPAKPKGTP